MGQTVSYLVLGDGGSTDLAGVEDSHITFENIPSGWTAVVRLAAYLEEESQQTLGQRAARQSAVSGRPRPSAYRPTAIPGEQQSWARLLVGRSGVPRWCGKPAATDPRSARQHS